ncbi:hypothetical protein C0991_010361 [Blastosporella zonata]|nr:hypothetical protein C0991_010361 [Blastosporella zonata]
MFSKVFTATLVALTFSVQAYAHAAISPALGVAGTPDGSRQVTLTVDATGVGKTFVAGTVTTNGDLAPTNVGSQQITASLPAGTKCTGGAAGNLCLAAFKTAGGFGNCVVVQQGSATGSAAAKSSTVAAAATSTTAAAATSAVVSSTTATATDDSASSTDATSVAATDASASSTDTASVATSTALAGEAAHKGTRAARALRAGLHAGGQLAKRSPLSWIWA